MKPDLNRHIKKYKNNFCSERKTQSENNMQKIHRVSNKTTQKGEEETILRIF
jgi:hypothetical protein